MKRSRRIGFTLALISLVTILSFQNCVKNPIVFLTNDSTGPVIQLLEKPNKSAFQYAKFRFIATEIGTGKVDKYECSLDGGEFKVCNTTVIYDHRLDQKLLAHAVGEKKKLHTFKVRSYDDWGNVGETVTHQWEIDLEDFSFLIEPLDGVIQATNQELINLNISYNMQFRNDSNLTMDKIVFNNPDIHIVENSLVKVQEADIEQKIIGKYTAQIRVPQNIEGDLEIKINPDSVYNEMDKGNNIAVAHLLFDRKAPESSLVDFLQPKPSVQLSGVHYTNLSMLNLQLTAISASHFSISNSQLNCLNNSNWEVLDPMFATTGKSYSIPLLNQLNTISVKFKDLAGNETSCINLSVIHDNIAPVLSNISDGGDLSNSLTSSLPISFTAATDANPLGQYTIYVGENSLNKTAILQTEFALYNQNLTSLNLKSNTTYYIFVSTKDIVGNTTMIQSDGWLVDNTAPTVPSNVVLGAIPQNLTTSPTITWTDSTDIGGSGVEKYQVMIHDNVANLPATGWTDLVKGSFLQNINPKLVSQNQYLIYVRAIDKAGNISGNSAAGMGVGAIYTSYNQPYAFQTQNIHISRSIASDQYPNIVKMIHQEDGKKLLVGNFVQYTNDSNSAKLNNKVKLTASGVLQSQIFPNPVYFSNNGTFDNATYDVRFMDIEGSNNIWMTGTYSGANLNCTNSQYGNVSNEVGFCGINKSQIYSGRFTALSSNSVIKKTIKCKTQEVYYTIGSNLSNYTFNSMFPSNPRPSTRLLKSDSEIADYNFYIDDTASQNFTDIAVDSQCRLIVVGNFTSYRDPKSGQTKTVGHIVRLNTDGSIESTFDGGLQNSDNTSAKYVSIDSNDNVYVSQDDYNRLTLTSQSGGNTTTNPTAVIFKFNSDGTPSVNFFKNINDVSRGRDNPSKHHKIFIDSNGNIYHSRNYVTSGVNTFYSLIKIKPDGNVDSEFKCPQLNQAVTPYFTSNAIYLAGQFLYQFPDGKYISNILKVDQNCQPVANTLGTGFSGPITYLKELTNGELLIQGQFDMYNQKIAPGILRLNADLSIDTTFNPGKSFLAGPGFNQSIGKITNAARDEVNKKYYLAGEFRSFNNTQMTNLVRLNENGSVDSSFNHNLTQFDKIGNGLTVSQAGNLYYNLIRFSDPQTIQGKNIYKNGTVFVQSIPADSVYPQNLFSGVNQIAVDANENIIVTGRSDIRRFNVNGVLEQLNYAQALAGDNGPPIINKIRFDQNNNLWFCLSNKTYIFNNQAVGKLLANGTFDSTFNSNTQSSINNCNDFTLDQQGRVIVSTFISHTQTIKTNIARLKSDGKTDPSFNINDLNMYQDTLKFLGLDPQGNISFITNDTQYKNDAKLLFNGPGLFLAP